VNYLVAIAAVMKQRYDIIIAVLEEVEGGYFIIIFHGINAHTSALGF